MAQTVSTAAVTVLATAAAEVVKRVDFRVFRDLCSDTGVALASSAAVVADANFLALVRDAYAEMESACLVGKRYTAADIVALVADTGVAAGKFYNILSRIVTALAWERRPSKFTEEPISVKKAEEALQALRDGERIFSFEESAVRGNWQYDRENANDVETRDGLVVQCDRLFGRRGNRR